MKNSIRIIALALILVTALALLASCGNKLSGTYESEAIFGLSAVYTFDGENFTKEELGIEVTGTYTIEDDKIIFTYDSALAEKLGLETSKTCSFEKDGDTVKIDGTTYTKKN